MTEFRSESFFINNGLPLLTDIHSNLFCILPSELPAYTGARPRYPRTSIFCPFFRKYILYSSMTLRYRGTRRKRVVDGYNTDRVSSLHDKHLISNVYTEIKRVYVYTYYYLGPLELIRT